jgi:ribosomal subunit interface protein
MTFTYAYKNAHQSQKLIKEIETTLSRLEKYFSKEVNCSVLISNDNDARELAKLKITLYSGKETYRTEQSAENHYKAVDLAYDKLKTQICHK